MTLALCGSDARVTSTVAPTQKTDAADANPSDDAMRSAERDAARKAAKAQ